MRARSAVTICWTQSGDSVQVPCSSGDHKTHPMLQQSAACQLHGRCKCRDHHGGVLSWGEQHDAAEAVELLIDGLSTQLRRWVAGSLAPGLQTPSLAHLTAISQLPACAGAAESWLVNLLLRDEIQSTNCKLCSSRSRRTSVYMSAGYQAAELPSRARLFSTWRQLTRLPLVGMLRDDSVCLSCRTAADCQLTPFTLLTLPIALTLQQCLEKFTAVAYVHDVDCTR